MTKIKNPLVFLDVSIDGDPYEKMVFELFSDVAPKTAENFRALCTGEMGNGSRTGKPLHYKGSFFHRINRGSMAEGGDFVKRDGSSGESIYGSNFPDELPKLKHDQPGILSMSVSNRDHLGSQFILTFKPNHSFDRKFVVFGKLVHGDDVLKKIEAAGDDDGSPKVTVKIVNCGELKDGKRKLQKLKMGKDSSSDTNHIEGRKDKHKKSSSDRRKKRKRYYSSDSDTSSDDSESELSDSDTSDSETDISSDDSSSHDRHRKKKRSYKKDRHRRGRKRDGRKDKKRRRRDKKTRRRSRRSSDSSSDGSDSGSSSSESGDDGAANDLKSKASDNPKANAQKETDFPTVNGRARTNGVDAENVGKLHRRLSPQKLTSKSVSISPKNNSISPRSVSKSPIKPSFNKSPKRIPVRERSYSPAAKPQPRRISPRAPRSPIRKEPSPSPPRVGNRARRSVSRSPPRVGRSTRRSVSRSPPRRARSPSAGSLSGSPDESPKRIRRGRGFSDRFAYARRYRTPSPTRSPIRHRYGRNERDRYISYRRYSPKRFRSPPRRTPPRNRRSYSRSQSVSRSPRYRGGRRFSRSLSRSRSPAGGPRVLKNERRRSRSVSRSPSRSRSSASRSPVVGKRGDRGRSKSSSDSGAKKGLVSYDDGSP